MEEMKCIYCLLCIDFLLIFAIAITHIVFYSHMKENDLINIFDIFEEFNYSPLFDFNISSSCGKDSYIIFHALQGATFPNNVRINGKEINRINGYYFCYKYKSYKYLLYNNQIIKGQCGNTFPKDCGIIDTLEQHLCIKDGEKCPLYDIRIDEPKNTGNYTYKEEADIYYNNDNYEEHNKKIIGSLILSDGQPCYNLYKKLWKKFTHEDVGDNNLECDYVINGRINDERYEKLGNISYKRLYEDNFPEYDYKIIKDFIKKDEFVSLYKRELIGLDKECNNLYNDNQEKLRKNQKNEKTIILAESIIIFSSFIILVLFLCLCCSKPHGHYGGHIIAFMGIFFIIICVSLNLTSIICQSIFLERMIKYNTSYDCSDEITNEILKAEINTNESEMILYTVINLGLDAFFFSFNIIAILSFFINEKIREKKFIQGLKKNEEKNNNKKNYEENKNNSNEINKTPVKEVIVDNKIPEISNQISKTVNNSINKSIVDKFNNNPNPPPILDLSAKLPVERGDISNVNIL